MFNWGLAILLFLVLIWLSGQHTIDYLRGNVENFIAEVKIIDSNNNTTETSKESDPTSKDNIDSTLLRGLPLSEVSRSVYNEEPDDYWNPFQAYIGSS